VADVLADGIAVIEYRSGGGAPQLFPAPSTRLEPGDGLIAQGPFEAMGGLRGEGTEGLRD
jgi:hypothetical protein